MIGLFLYGGAALLYIIALRRIPMSVALPCTASSYIAAALIGYYEFAEPLTAMHLMDKIRRIDSSTFATSA